ncbi:hypothetical protein GXM_09677 [Nostoc sphaeroides CCNUC1]|uniref:Uncharacterized protein n=1 Tax=Nostoc sphaeroides CCNUC1 TaxID=2653204 RepID=A0A5P8WH52_9NOSO|nr:hypothetical protein GXM_09677 [Nostoc sphaeroides CCNUC1]
MIKVVNKSNNSSFEVILTFPAVLFAVAYYVDCGASVTS